ncbi:amidophosphoribosyltransferase [Prevotella sp. E15-22]|uniref:amidophosphoribosyltransferase n=1 Tax=Prevotella sp. E15-22 TaxID=2937774 RepID=UPI002050309A|nr:amidophosphoribosyltransferase [Prevotella sp. E15-22]UPS45201.1 amidophosphoribosyltransferase [Prevotella sp. E15-22]
MEQLKHECGVAMIRLLKPLDYYEKKYGTWTYGFNKLYLMMEKQHNRGQEGAGIASVSLTNEPGTEYMFREKAEGKGAITEIFSRVTEEMKGELLMGHLRYSTTGKSGLTFVHPFLRRNNWRAKNLCLCGNFNMTNIDEVFSFLTEQGQSPRIYGDSYITLELMGHRLDREVERLYQEATAQGLKGTDITNYIDEHVEMANVLRSTMEHYDGGYVMCGLTGSGEMFSVRDPWGIRPAFYYRDDELIAIASERPVLQTTFDIQAEDVHELLPGQALIIHKSGESRLEQIMPAQKLSACSFERIYFSRGSDCDIYQERKRLGEQLTPAILKAIDFDVTNTVFSYIPNTAEVAFYGMTDGFRKLAIEREESELAQIPEREQVRTKFKLHGEVRTEKVVWKDIKLRTFIADNSERNDLAAHVYDISYGSLEAGKDNLVIIDDSIVRGTTLKESIFKILDRLHPKKIVMVSSSPQIRYPDYYGIDMARLEEFCAFRATMALIEERGMWQLINDTYLACKRELEKPKEEMVNCVRAIYAPFTVDEINQKIVEMLRPADMKAPIELVFQSIEGLHEACPNHPGDWYFTGHYPTPGGVKLVNQAFVNYINKTYTLKENDGCLLSDCKK